jgi:hypothetical protein
MAEKKYYYLYETTNLTNGKKYVGQHCTRNLDDGYFGSCKELIADNKRGHVLSVKILEFFEGVTQLGNAEYEYIKKHGLIQDGNYYNKSNTRFYNWFFGQPLGDEARKKISENNGMKKPGVINPMQKPGANNPMKNPEVRKKVSEALKLYYANKKSKQEKS